MGVCVCACMHTHKHVLSVKFEKKKAYRVKAFIVHVSILTEQIISFLGSRFLKTD